MSRAFVLLLAVGAAAAPAQPRITGIDPQGVRVGGTFSIVIDASVVTHPLVVTVFRERPPRTDKHTSKPLVDNGEGDDAPQTGIIRYRIKTDASWLSAVSLSANAAEAQEQYGIAIRPVSAADVPTLEPANLVSTLTVFATAGVVDIGEAIHDEFNTLLSAILSIQKLTEAARTQKYSVHNWKTDMVVDGVVAELPNGWLAPGSQKMILNSDPDVHRLISLQDPTQGRQVVEALLRAQRVELFSATAELEGALSAEQKDAYQVQLANLKRQLSVLEKPQQ